MICTTTLARLFGALLCVSAVFYVAFGLQSTSVREEKIVQIKKQHGDFSKEKKGTQGVTATELASAGRFEPATDNSVTLVVAGDCNWGNVWHFMFQCVYPMVELRLKHPDAVLAVDLSVEDEGYRLYYSKRLGSPRPENITTPVFKAYAKMLEQAVGKVKYVWEAGTQERLTLNHELKRPRNKTIWRVIQQAVLDRLELSAAAASKCIYITRRHAKTRVLYEEVALTKVLAEVCLPRPLDVVAMEKLDFAEQVAKIAGASTVFIERGAAMAFTVFLRAGAQLVYIDGPDNSTWMLTTTELPQITRVAALVKYENFAPKLHVDVGMVKDALLSHASQS